MNVLAKHVGGVLRVFSADCCAGIFWIDQRSKDVGPRRNLMQQFQPLRHHRRTERSNAGEIAPRAIEAWDEADTERGDDGYLSAHEVCCQAGQCVELPLSEGGLDSDALAVHDVNFLESLPDRIDNFHLSSGSGHQEPDHRHSRLLRARRERPSRRAAEKGDELAALHLRAHSITSSATASSVGGTSSPSALAVRKLITSWYWVGCWTGRSAGFSPLRTRST